MFDQPFSPVRFSGSQPRKAVQFGSDDKSNVVDITSILEEKRRERETKQASAKKPGFFSVLLAGIFAYIASKVLMSCLSVLGGFFGFVNREAGIHPAETSVPSDGWDQTPEA